MRIRYLFIIGLSALAWRASATCVADGPLDTARWIYANQPGFASYELPQSFRYEERFLSPELLDLLETEWKCQGIEEGICALESDSWTNAQDGEVLPPIAFDLVSTTASQATVRMSFRFGWSDVNTPKPVAAQATLSLAKDATSSCWLLVDLVGREGRSLVKQIQSYRYP